MPLFSKALPGLALALVLSGIAPREISAEEKLTDFDFLLLGLSVRPEPEVQTVPRNTASGLFVRIEFSSSSPLSVEPELLLSLLPSGLEVAAEIVGPGLEAGVQIRAAPGKLLPIPPLSTRGLYVVRDIRLLLDGEPYLRASPDVATVEVIDRVLVTRVTTRPLTLEEIRQKGILFGDDSFTGYNFQLVLRLDNRPVTIDLSAVFDSNDVPIRLRPTGSIDISGPGLPALSAGLTPILMKPDLPRIDSKLLAQIPSDLRIPGLLVVPGDVGFLNQFFSALLLVSNGAPSGSGLSVHSLEGEILLPDGDDGVGGTTDDPLRLALTEGGPPAGTRVAPIRGPEGDRFDPGEQGQAEYLLEGRREGFHEIRFDIAGSLDGLPVGTIPIRGEARGGVLVRNRDFHLTFSAPATVRSQEEFTLYVTVTNTSLDNAPLVRVGIGAAVSGASLIPGEADVRSIEDLGPRESETLPFRFVSTQTGQVTASYLRVEQGTGRLLFRLGVGERGVPLSSDTLVLPSTVEALASPAEKSARRSPRVVQAALRVLGQGWSIATAPAGTVPEDVSPVSRQVVLDRATAIGEAGFRVELGESLQRALLELAMDFLGDSDPGFFEIVHETDAGGDFLAAIGKTLGEIPSLPADVASLNLELAEDLSSRAKHLVVGIGGTAPPIVELFGPTRGGFVPLEAGSGLLLVPKIEGSLYEVRFQASATGSFDLALNVPFVGGGTGVYLFEDVAVDAGTSGRVVVDLRRSPDRLRLDLGPAGAFDSRSVRFEAPRGPKLLAATAIGPETLNGADPWGRLVALLFDREVRAAEAESTFSYEVEANAILSARRQLSGRLVFLFLRDPVGNFIPREVAVEGLFDPRGMPMSPFLQREVITSRLTDPGAIVSGRVLDATGNPVPTAEVLYLNTSAGAIGLSQKSVSPDGSYGFDYVRRSDRGGFAIRATDPESGAIQELATRVTEDGEHIKVDLVLRGRGGVEGYVRNLAGEPRPGARVLATSQADPTSFAFAEANGDGFYRATGVVVGPVSVKAVDGAFSGVASGNVYRAGAFARIDLVLNQSQGRVQGRVFELVEGVATAPLPDVEVYYVLEENIVAASTRTDAAGAYAFEGMPTGRFRILALDRVTNRRTTSPLHTLSASGQLEIDVFLEREKVGTIRGTVSDGPDGGVPVSGVLVQAAGRQVVTSPEFVLANVPVGTHTVSASLPGTNRTAHATVVVVEGDTTNVDLRLSGTGQVVVRVLDPRGHPIAGQQVIRISGSTPCGGEALTTGPDGTVTFEGVTVPGATFKASRDGDIASGSAVLAREGETVLLTLRFGGFGTVFGVVSDESGPVFGADVSLGSLRFDSSICEYVLDGKARQMRTDSLGRYRFEKVPVGSVSITASAGTGTSLPATAKSALLFDSEARELNLTLTDNLGGRIEGTVLLPDGRTPAGEGVRVSTTSPIGAEVAVVTRDDGSYEFARILAPGRYELRAHDPVSGRVARETVYLQAEQDVVADVRLLGLGTVVVTVRDGSGVVVNEAFVELEGTGFPFDERAGAIVPTDGGRIRFERVTEGSFTVSAASEGKGGRATGSVSGEGSVANLTVHLTSVGRIVGVLKSPDGAAGVPNAEILVKQGGTGRLVGSTTTSGVPEAVPLECRALLGSEALGFFTLFSVPAGSLLATATDPLTGRIGESSARIEADGKTACVEIRLLGLGTLAGFVESGAERVAGARVELTSSTGLSSVANLRAEATTDGAGAFRFEGVPVGSFTLRATVPGLLLTGTSTGAITRDGESLTDIDIALQESGSLEGTVTLADGTTPVAGALLTLKPTKGLLRTESRADGSFAFEFVPAGDFTLTAEETGGFDGGILGGRLEPNEHLEGLVVKFRGTGTIEGAALDSAGFELSSGLVRLSTPPPFARSETATVGGSGSFRFVEVPVGSFELVLEVVGSPLRGIASGEIANDGDVVPVSIKLQPARPVFGRVVREDRTTPAPNVSVTLKSGGFAFQDLTDEAAGFRFGGVPLGAFTLRAEDALTGGVALASGVLDDSTPETGLDLGTLVLDTTPIQVESTAPADGATLVPPDSAVEVTFTDPLGVSSLVGFLTVTSSGANAPGSLEILPDGVTGRFTPTPFLPPRSLLTIVVSESVKDVFGRTLGEEFRASFTTGGAVVTGIVRNQSLVVSGAEVRLDSGGSSSFTTTDGAGRYRFENVDPGTASILATSGGLSGSRVIEIAPEASVVSADVPLSLVGSVTGVVTEWDGAPSPEGLVVRAFQSGVAVGLGSTVFDGVATRYRIDNVALGSVLIDVENEADEMNGDHGQGSGTLIEAGAAIDVPVRMLGVGAVQVVVSDGLGAAIEGASVSLSFRRFGETTPREGRERTTDTLGEVVFPNVLAGFVSVFAESAGRSASGSIEAKPAETVTLPLTLHTFSRLRGRVVEKPNSTPVPGALVGLYRGSEGIPRAETSTDANGEFSFDDVPALVAAYRVDVSVTGRLRARARNVSVPEATDGFVELELVPVGAVAGDLTAPTALSSSVTVTLQSFAPDFGGTFTTTQIVGNRYFIEGVPPGSFQVTARDSLKSYVGESSGVMPPEVGSVEVDVALAANTFTIPVSGHRLTDGNDAGFRILRSGASTEGAGQVFSATTPGGMVLDLTVGPTTASYSGSQFGFREEGGRELVTARESLLGVGVQRKVYVPADGYFARYLDILENETDQPVSLTATLVSNLNDGSGAARLIEESEIAGRWLVLDDAADSDPFLSLGTLPAVAFVLSANAVVPEVEPLANGAGANERRLAVSYEITLPPRAKVVLLHFAVQQLSREAAKTAALRLSALAPEALVGLEADESSRVLNFDVPADGSSLVPPLPQRNGRVSGRLFANDGTTLVELPSGTGSIEVQLQSDHVLFRRVQSVFTTTGSFAFDPPALPLPRTGFTLGGKKTFGTFSTTTSLRREFTGNALVSRAPDVVLTAGSSISGRPPSSAVDGLVGTFWQPSGPERWLQFASPSPVTVSELVVLRHSSAVLTGVTLTLSGASSFVETFPFGAGAELLIPLDVSGVETIRLDFQGTTIQIAEVRIQGVASGDIGYALQDLVFSQSASIDISVRNADSDLISSIVQPQIGNQNVSDIAAPAGKVFLAPIPPQAPVVLNARGNVGHRFQRASVNVSLSAGVVTSVEIVLPVGARVSGQATNNAGAGIPSQTVNFFAVTGPGTGEGGFGTSTDATGLFAFEQVPSGTYRLRSTFGGLTLDIPFTVSAPTPAVQNLAFLSPGNIDLQVRFESADASQIVVNGARVELIDSQNQVWVRTTVNGLASFGSVPAGPFVLRITHPTNAASITERNGTLSPGQTLQLTLSIPAFGTVEGDVLFGDNSPATGGLVELLEPSVTRPPQTTTVAGFRFTTVRAAVELTLRARHPRTGRTHIFKEEKVTLPREGATLDVPITLPATGSVAVTVKRQDNDVGIQGVEVFIQDSFASAFRFEGTTDASGVRAIDIVPKGAFRVRAERGGESVGEKSGTVTVHGERVSVELVVSGDASVSGVVFGGDGETPVPEAQIQIRSADGAVLLRETTSLSDGSYRFDDAVEPGTSVLVRAFLPSAPGKSDERVVTASASGDPLLFDPVLPVSVIKGRVLEPDGATPVVGATVETTPYGALFGFTATSGESGEFAFFDSDLGVHSLVAEDAFGLASFARGTLASVDQALVVDLVLPEFGSVEVSVFDENAAALSEQPVMLRTGSLRSPRIASAASVDADGIYRFERVALGAFTVTYDEPDSFMRRSGSTSGRLTEIERVAAVAIELPGFTILFGELVEGGLPATPLDEFTPLAVEGRLQESSTGIYRKDGGLDGLDIEGDYRVENVPEGAITLTAIETLATPPIVSSQTAVVTADQLEHQVDIERGTAAGFDIELGPAFLVASDGTLFAQGTALARSVVNGKEYPALASASPDPTDPNHFVLGPIRTSGVSYRRDVYAPSGEKFVRYLEIFENPHGFDVEVTLRLESGLFVFATSSGDDRIDPADQFFTSFGPGTVIGGAGGRLADFAGSDFDTSFDLVWRKLVVPANGRLVLMHFGIGAADDVEALALAGSLSTLSHPRALEGLDPALRSSIVNFEIP